MIIQIYIFLYFYVLKIIERITKIRILMIKLVENKKNTSFKKKNY